MKRIAVAAAVAALVTMSGCAIDYTKKTPDEVAQLGRVVDSEFDRARLFAGPVVRGGESMGPTYSAQLFASQSKATGVVTHALFVTWAYSSSRWLFFRSASLVGGIEPPTAVGQRRVKFCSGSSCSYEEELTSVIPLAVLMNATNGLRIRYNSEGGTAMVELPANYVSGYLKGASTRLNVARVEPAPSDASLPGPTPTASALATDRPQGQTAAQSAAPVKPKHKIGRFSYEAEQLGEVRACNPYPAANLTAQGAGFETFSVACTNGDALAVRCESTGCRVLK
ncbi:MAG: hypothetical protein JSR28_18820 [Proteobacteria bacterium]|nr:hypothetical protein [Pseudomonadota bacterium]